jgi:hypothetical protein
MHQADHALAGEQIGGESRGDGEIVADLSAVEDQIEPPFLLCQRIRLELQPAERYPRRAGGWDEPACEFGRTLRFLVDEGDVEHGHSRWITWRHQPLDHQREGELLMRLAWFRS